MGKAVFCIATSEFQAEAIVNDLKAASFADNDISVLFPDKAGTKDFAHEQHTKAPEGAAVGAGAGVILGGARSCLMSIRARAMQGLEPFIAAGPIMAPLSDPAAGLLARGLTG